VQQQQSEEKFQVYEIRLDNPPVWPEGMNATQAQLAVPEWGILEFIGEFASNEDDGARSEIFTDQARPHYTANNSDTSYSRPIMELSSWWNFLMYSLPPTVSKILASRKAMNHG
jgi:hypothetical protein